MLLYSVIVSPEPGIVLYELYHFILKNSTFFLFITKMRLNEYPPSTTILMVTEANGKVDKSLCV